jgi:hypothetical protein
MPLYEVFVHIALLEKVPKRGSQRQQIMDFIYSLRANPYTPGDFTDKDASFRVRQVKILGDFAITYWVDDPVKVVMIIYLHPADK